VSDDLTALEPGASAELSVMVTEEMTAARYGNSGVEVLATPYLIGLLESVSVLAIKPALGPDQGTVGTAVDVRHEAATPPGMRVTAAARLVQVDDRRLTFQVEAHDERERIMFGTHERFVVELERFLTGTRRKASGSD